MAQPIAYYDPSRQLVRVVELDDVKHHPDADRLDLAVVDGWQVIVGRGVWKKGDKALFCEVGGLLPITVPEFFDAARDSNVKTFNEIEYAYIKSLKLRKEISQGFICPIPAKHKDAKVGTDLTRELGALKYEASPQQVEVLGGSTLGDRHEQSLIQKAINFIGGEPVSNLLPFPDEYLSRSSAQRAQNKLGMLSRLTPEEDSWEMSVKLDGNSMAILFKKNRIIVDGNIPDEIPEDITTHLLSRDTEISLKPVKVGFVKAARLYVAATLNSIRRRFNGAEKVWWPEFQTVIPVANNHFTQMYNILMADGLLERVRAEWGGVIDTSIAIQGEVIGPNVIAGSRNNYEGVKELQFRCFHIFIDGEELSPEVTRDACKILKLQTVPILDTDFKLRTLYTKDEASGREFLNIRELLKLAEGHRALTPGGQREGIYLKSNKTKTAVKVISNAFLLKNGDD